jgi:dissimilatory sulfite reductase (desulfoviridin) alpha/beta subunit
VGLVGFVRPAVEPADCTACGACATSCPDAAISVDNDPPVFEVTACQGCLRCHNACPFNCIHLSRPGVRVLLGGKLGRHPRLAEAEDEICEPAEVIKLLDRVVGAYLESAEPDERFADFLLRTDCLRQ